MTYLNKRQKKKRIPKDTEYCYQIIGREKDESVIYTKRCPHYKIIDHIEDTMVDHAGTEHPCTSPVVYCSYAKVSSEEDFLLLDRVKTCGERTNRINVY